MTEPRLTRLADLLLDWEADAIAAHACYIEGTPRGPLTQLPTLDRELGGAILPGVHFLDASPGAGKTALASQIAATAQCPALYVTAEMAVLELFRRHTARVTGTYLGKFKTGELSPAISLGLARQAAAAAPELAYVDATRAPAYPTWLAERAEVLRGRAAHFLIVIDSVHSWAEAFPVREVTEYDALNAAIASLRGLASQLGCAVLGIAERNRTAMSKGGLSASAGSRKFEYGSESVWSLDRKEDAQPDAAGETEITLTLQKNRNGAPGRRVRLKFHGALQRFREVG